MDRSWMHLRNKLCKEYLDGIKSFMKVAEQCAHENNLVRCPCKECQNAFFKSLHIVKAHLKRYGIAASYTKWVFHGEEPEFVDNSQMNVGSMPSNRSAFTFDNEEDDDEMYNLIHDMWEPMSMDAVTSETNIEENVDMIHDDTREFRMGAGLLEKAGKSLFPGSKLSALSFIVKLMHIKVLNKLSNKAIDMILQLLKEAFPEGTTLPSTTYDAKKMLKDLGLGYEVIHACKFDCALFWKEYKALEKCPYCGEPRYKFEGSKKKVPQKVLRYFPLKPRLQRLFISRHTTWDMRWHQEKRVAEEGILRHPADGEAWKEFDRLYPWFAQEPRNVRMGLATDGFNPFGNMHNSYSMWPIILVPYNLPPWKCMKDPFMMMSLLIPGPKAPGRDIDVYIRPLIDELKELWNHGVETFDASTRQTFHMHAAVMWTINDFPAYGNLSGWSTKGYKACPVCNVETSSRKLNSKICYMGHRRYLPHGHSWRASREHDGDFEFDPAPKEYLGDDILRQLEKINEARPGKNENNKDRKRKRSASDLNWTKKSIFFELEYWSKLKIRHILDVMHIEKNICDSLVGTLLNIEGKTKYTVKARLDLEDLR